MIVYSETKRNFFNDIENNCIAERILERLSATSVRSGTSLSEIRSWENSLSRMYTVLNDVSFPDDLKVAIEYQVPLTAKRVDFIITGRDDINNDHVMIVELKQWESATQTDKDQVVKTFVGKGDNEVTHPSYQALSYAKTIENFNETVQLSEIQLHPCAYLHNYKEEYRSNIDNEFYIDSIREAPLFLKSDSMKLREFIKKYIKKSDDGSLLYKIENGKIKPSKSLQDSVRSMLSGNEEFVMIDEQKVTYETILNTVLNTDINKKYTIIIEGGPGTGKSVIAINLLCNLLNKNLSTMYVSKNSAPRNVYLDKLKGSKFKKVFINSIFKGSGQFVNASKNDLDCMLVDEAHRLNEKSGMYKNLGENQIKEIIYSSRVSVFFIDEAQQVTSLDIGSIDEIKKWANVLGSEIIYGDNTKLSSQFRCNGSDAYLAFIDNLLQIRDTANKDIVDLDYDFKVFDDPNEMREALRLKNIENNKSRMLAGYCYPWLSKKDINEFDILLDKGFKAQWNFANTSTWATDENSFDQVGCIHTSQGLEFDYVGVIIGKDLRYEKGVVITDKNARDKYDSSMRGIKKDSVLTPEKIIKNTYRTLLTRGQKGCYVYCEDRNMMMYIKSFLNEER